MTIAVLISVGRHRASGRARPANLDLKALEQALRLVPPEQIIAIHSGPSDGDTVLRGYLGLGLGKIVRLDLAPDSDPTDAIVDYLGSLAGLDLVLAGCAAEAGEGSGQLPYDVAHRLRLPLLAAVTELSRNGGTWHALQALPRGQRQRLAVEGAAFATIDEAAPAARQSAFGKARRGVIEVIPVGSRPVVDPFSKRGPARSRPKRMIAAAGMNAADRLRALTEMAKGGGELLVQPGAEAAAQAIWDYLCREGIVEAGGVGARENP